MNKMDKFKKASTSVIGGVKTAIDTYKKIDNWLSSGLPQIIHSPASTLHLTL